MATYRIIPILKTVSSPADPDAPSFLTTLPPEIRNGIYELLFTRDEPVVLHGGKAYRRLLDREVFDFGSDMDTDSEDEEQEQIHARQHVKDDHIWHRFNDCTPLLMSCRMVYHEAAGVLYGSNTFLFSRALHQKDCRLYDQTLAAAQWLSSIGSQFSLLSKVQLDADAICPEDCHYSLHHKKRNLLPLLRVIWANAHASCEILYVSAGLIPDHVPYHSISSRVSTRAVPIKVLNNLLLSLGRNDALNIKRYANFKLLMSAVYLQGTHPTLEGYVVHEYAEFKLTSRHNHNYFDILEDGARVCPRTKPGPILLQLPHEVLGTIFRLVCTSKTDVVFDLDSKTTNGLQKSLLGVNRQVRRTVTFYFRPWVLNKFILSMATELPITDFNDFTALAQWSRAGLFRRMVHARRRQTKDVPEVILNFKLSDPTTFDDLRINIRKLLHLLRGLDDQCTVVIAKTPTTTASREHMTEVRINLGDTRRAVFLLLSDMLKQFRLLDSFEVRAPQIWIDGRGRILDARYPAARKVGQQTVRYMYGDLNGDEVHDQGYRLIQHLYGRLDAGCQRNEACVIWNNIGSCKPDTSPKDSLLLTWAALRDEYFANWRSWMRERDRLNQGSEQELD